MIITVTPNPSIDRTVTLDRPLERGGVHRLSPPVDAAGGKGVNVARVLHRAGIDVVALLPAPEQSQILTAIDAEGIDVTRTAGPSVRTNLTLVEADGTTTKLNEPGGELSGEDLRALEEAILAQTSKSGVRPRDTWVVLAGSLPRGIAPNWYARMTVKLRMRGVRVAVDTSDAPIRAFAEAEVLPDLLKPNGFELAVLTGNSAGTGQQLESAAANGDFEPVLAAANGLHRRGCGAVLVTLGAAGAVLVTEGAAWVGTPPPIVPRSTVGAGDSSLAGYLRGVLDESAPAERLRLAVASGSAAASMPGTGLPGPEDLDLDHTEVRPLRPLIA